MRKHLLLIVACFILIMALPVMAQDGDVPRFEAGECAFAVTEGQTVECGFVVVPEDRSDPENSNTIKLAVVIFRAGDDAPADPVMLLSGGPGEKTVANANFAAGSFLEIAPDRDLIVFDQRGVGLSEPALECPEWNEAFLASLNEADPEKALTGPYDALTVCHERLVAEGYNLSAYNTVQNAADVNDIMVALGYQQVNLLGVSYGSVLAQAVMRDFPDIVRSVIIDSVLPLSGSFFVDTATTASQALDNLLAACTADEACNAAYPNLRQVLFDLIDKLNVEPVDITLTNPLTGAKVPSRLSGDSVLSNLVFFLYQAPILPQLPQTIFDVAAGDYTLMTQLSSFSLIAFEALTRGMNYSVFCADDLIGRTPEDYLNVIAALPPQYQGSTDIEVVMEYNPFNVCANWEVEQSDPAVKEPVVSDVPTLVMGGEFDPVTPFAYAEIVAENLSNSYVYEFPAVGHSVNVSSECARSITGAFINNPDQEPDTACLDALTDVAFVLPGAEPAAVTLVDYENADAGFSGVQPEGWQEIGPGTFTRGATGTDQTVVIQQIAPNTTIDQFLAIAQGQLGLDAAPEPTSTYEANGLTWNLYELDFMGYPADVALAQGEDGNLYVVQLVSGNTDERDFLLEQVFLPTIDAFTPAG
jgi:pimeloyl-ACP methyl ester carboxylesterase